MMLGTNSKLKIVVDNGGGNIKAGFSTDKIPRVIPNVIAKNTKKEQYVGSQIDRNCPSFESLVLRRPLQKGYLVDFEAQIEVWTNVFESELKILEKGGYSNASLFLSEPPNNPHALKRDTSQIVFETYGFSEYCCSTSIQWNLLQYSSSNPQSNIAKSQSALIIDSGFSFSHVLPIVDRKLLSESIKRVNVGGKLLTNYLREIISYRYYNMMDETWLINQIKEDMCHVSMDFKNEIDHYNPSSYILPDYVSRFRGAVKNPLEPKNPNEQLLTLNNEKVSIPEILFHPSDIGLQQAGIAESVVQSVDSVQSPIEKSLLYDTILLVGGNTLFKNYTKRFYEELRPLVPEKYNVTVHTPDDPISHCWKGGAFFARLPAASKFCVSKAEYEEYGYDKTCKMKFF